MDPDWEEIYKARYARLVALIATVTGSLGDAEEAVQEAFVRALGHGGRGVTDPEAWLYRVAVNHVRSRWRRRAVALRHATGAPVTQPPPAAENAELMEALRRLPYARREALALHYMADLPIAEIARRLDVAEGTVKARLSRGRTALRDLLHRDADEIEEWTHA